MYETPQDNISVSRVSALESIKAAMLPVTSHKGILVRPVLSVRAWMRACVRAMCLAWPGWLRVHAD